MGKDLKGKNLGKGFTQRKDGRYQTRIYLKGKKNPICLYGQTLNEVKKKKNELLKKTEYGLKIDANKITLNQWFEQWMSLYVVNRVKKTTIRNYIESYNRCIEYIGDIKLSDIQITHIQNMVNELTAKGYKKKTIQSSVSLISNCFKRAIIGKLLIFNPCEGIIYPNTSNGAFDPIIAFDKKIERLSNDEIRRFFEAARGTRYYELFVLLLFTGLRIGEACSLEWTDIDFQNNCINVYKTINEVTVYYDDQGHKLEKPYRIKQITSPKKEASVRKVPLFKAAADALISWKEKQDRDKHCYRKKWGVKNDLLKNYPSLIFTTQYGNCYLPTQAGRECSRITSIMNSHEKSIAAIEHREFHPSQIHPHLFRHTFVTLCYESGMDPASIILIVGHSNIKMMQYYTHPDATFVNNEFDKYTEYVNNYSLPKISKNDSL